MSYVNNRLHIYDHIHCGNLVASLSKGVTDPESEMGHTAPDRNLGMGLGDYFAGFLEEQCRGFGWTVEEVDGVRFGG